MAKKQTMTEEQREAKREKDRARRAAKKAETTDDNKPQKRTPVEKELHSLRKQRQLVVLLDHRLTAAKENVKEAKAKLEGARSALDAMIDESHQGKLDFEEGA